MVGALTNKALHASRLLGRLQWPVFKHITIVNDDSSIINKSKSSLTDDARVVTYNRQMFRPLTSLAYM